MAPTQAALYDELSERAPPLVVGGGAPGARADEARPPSPPVPREVRPAARRGTSRSLRAARRTGARPVRRLGDDARPVPRVRVRRGRRRRRGVQLPAHAREDAALRPLPARDRAARRARRRGRSRARARAGTCASGSLREAAAELLHFRSIVDEYEHADVLRVVLARAARSARLTTHFDLDFPRAPQREPYWCHKHRRECAPVQEADEVPLPLPPRHARADQGVPEGARAPPRGRGRARRLERRRARRPLRRDPHVAAVSRA